MNFLLGKFSSLVSVEWKALNYTVKSSLRLFQLFVVGFYFGGGEVVIFLTSVISSRLSFIRIQGEIYSFKAGFQ